MHSALGSSTQDLRRKTPRYSLVILHGCAGKTQDVHPAGYIDSQLEVIRYMDQIHQCRALHTDSLFRPAMCIDAPELTGHGCTRPPTP